MDRSSPSVWYVPWSKQVYLYGGSRPYKGIEYTDFWRFGFGGSAQWELLIPDGESPIGPRDQTVAVVDADAKRLLMFGGIDNEKWGKWIDDYTPVIPDLADVWVHPLQGPPEAWKKLELAEEPAPRYWSRGVLHSDQNTLYVFGGSNYVGTHVGNELLALSLVPGEEAWLPLDIDAKPPLPQECVAHALVLDTKRNRLVLIGGLQAFGGLDMHSTPWAIELEALEVGWYPLEQVNAPGNHLIGVEAVYEPNADRIYVYGASIYDTVDSYWDAIPDAEMEEVWVMAPDGESTVVWHPVTSRIPSPLVHAPLLWDPRRGFGLTVYGLNYDAGAGSDESYSEEVRAWAILDPIE